MRTTLVFFVVLSATNAAAQAPTPEPQQRAARQRGSDAAPQSSESADAGAVDREIHALVDSGDRRAVAELRQRVRDGLPPQLLEVVIDGLARTRRADAIPVLEELSRYRRPAIRKKVADALGQLGVQSGARYLARMLDDPSPVVRSAAAEALGVLGPRSAMDELLRAAKRGVPQALTVVGIGATPAHIARILRDLDATSCDALAPALESFATRTDLSTYVRIRVVQRLGELATPGTQRLLQQIVSSLPEGDRVRKAAEDAMAAAAQGAAGGTSANGDSAGARTPREHREHSQPSEHPPPDGPGQPSDRSQPGSGAGARETGR